MKKELSIVNQKLTLKIRREGAHLTAKIGNGLFWVELMDPNRNLFAWGVNIYGPTRFHTELVAPSDWDALDVTGDVLAEKVLWSGRVLPQDVADWVDDNAATLARVQAFCGGAR